MNIREFARWNIPFQHHPLLLCFFMLTDMHDGGSVI